MRKYLTTISAPRVRADICYYTDTPDKNYRIYYCGSDTGARYEKIGNAARALDELARQWEKNIIGQVERIYSHKNEIPRRGSNA